MLVNLESGCDPEALGPHPARNAQPNIGWYRLLVIRLVNMIAPILQMEN